MMRNDHHQEEIDLQELEKQILDNSLYLIAYEDINARYPEKYEVRRSSVLKKRMTNHVSVPYYQYHLYLLVEVYDESNDVEKMKYIDIGVIHPNDLVGRLQEHGDTIRITKVEIRRGNGGV